MSTYLFRSNLSPREYLQAKSFEDSIKNEISLVRGSLDESTTKLIASTQQSDQWFDDQARKLQDSMSEGFDGMTRELCDVRGDLSVLNSTFTWGFSEVLLSLGRLRDSVEDLILAVKSPSKNWAYEKYRDAQVALRRELYDKALEYIEQAIGGFQGHTGYDLEHRFHFFKGTICLGSYKNSNRDWPTAKASFLTAARNSQKEFPNDAGLAYCAAGHSAECMGELDEALELTNKALEFLPQNGEANYQAARIQYRLGDPAAASENLITAIVQDRGYALRAASDEEFTRHEYDLRTAMEDLLRRLRPHAGDLVSRAKSSLAAVKSLRFGPFESSKYIGPLLSKATETLDNANRAKERGTLFDLFDAVQFAQKVEADCKEARAVFLRSAVRDADSKIRDLESGKQSTAKTSSTSDQTASKAFFITAVLVCPAPLFWALSQQIPYARERSKSTFGFAVELFPHIIMDAIIIGIPTLVIALVVSLIAKSISNDIHQSSQNWKVGDLAKQIAELQKLKHEMNAAQ